MDRLHDKIRYFATDWALSKTEFTATAAAALWSVALLQWHLEGITTGRQVEGNGEKSEWVVGEHGNGMEGRQAATAAMDSEEGKACCVYLTFTQLQKCVWM